MGRHKKEEEIELDKVKLEEISEEKKDVGEEVSDGLNLKVEESLKLKPKELPLVITGDWKNDTQAEYARVLNGYAYKNPEKWAKKKEQLIANLKLLGEKPEEIVKFQGVKNKNLSFKNQLMQ